MQQNKTYEWVKQNQARTRLLLKADMPLTARQLGRKTGLGQQSSGSLLSKFAARQLCVCINPEARTSRLYKLTRLGKELQDILKQELNLTINNTSVKDIDWQLYGRLCYRHRSLVLISLTEPMQPAQIRRKIRSRNRAAKISANNVRDVIRFFEKEKIVKKVFVKKKARPKYELTGSGWIFRELLIKANQ